MTKSDIINAYCRIRTIDNTIPDDVLDFMKEAAIEKLNKDNSALSQQSKIVQERLIYHFGQVGGGWLIDGMNAPFMKEFLNEVNRLVILSKQ